MLLASAPWFEFWGHGVWRFAAWTHLHASGWVWALRGDLLVGLVCAWVIIVGMSGTADRLSLAVAAFAVVVWLVIPGVTVLLSLFAFFAPALIVGALALAGWEQVARLWHGRGDESSPL